MEAGGSPARTAPSPQRGARRAPRIRDAECVTSNSKMRGDSGSPPQKRDLSPTGRVRRHPGPAKRWQRVLLRLKRGAELLPSPCSLQGRGAGVKAGPEVSLLPWEGR